MATLDTLKHEYDLCNTCEKCENQSFYGSIWQNKWQSYKMLATVMTGIAIILAAANKFAHLIARLKVQVKQILESVAIVFDADLYVIAAGLLAQQAAQHPNSVVKSHAVFFRPYLEVLARSSE